MILSLGVMTGTSCDGADLALLEIDERKGKTNEKLRGGDSISFPAALRARLREAQRGELSIRKTALLEKDYSLWLAKVCDTWLRKKKVSREKLILSIHGQTIWHEPSQGISVQLLEPALISEKTGCTVICRFRQPDLARGGEGAPLVPYYHWLKSKSEPWSKLLPFCILNLGGIANITLVSSDLKKVIAFDTGPANALIDLSVEKLTKNKKHFDSDGEIAREFYRSINWKKIENLVKSEKYFSRRSPKSTGRELFNEKYLSRIPGSGGLKIAHATAFTAHSLACAFRDFILPKEPRTQLIFAAGGGAENPTLLRFLSRELARLTGKEIVVTELPESFCPPQALEAAAFARFGYEALLGKEVSIKNITGAKENAIGAGIFPGQNFKKLLKALHD